MDEFLHCVSGKQLAENWESSLDAFKTSVKSFLRPCKHIGKIDNSEIILFSHNLLISGILYYHILEHFRDFCKETNQSPGLSCNDQVVEANFRAVDFRPYINYIHRSPKVTIKR